MYLKTFIKHILVFVGLLLPVAVLAKGGNDVGSSTDWAGTTVCFVVIVILSMLLPLRATGFMTWMLATTCILGLGAMVCHAYLSPKLFSPYLGWVPPFILVAAIVYTPALFLAVAAVAIYRGRLGRKPNDLSKQSSELSAAGAAGSRSP
jgi:hypothetical protein